MKNVIWELVIIGSGPISRGNQPAGPNVNINNVLFHHDTNGCKGKCNIMKSTITIRQMQRILKMQRCNYTMSVHIICFQGMKEYVCMKRNDRHKLVISI